VELVENVSGAGPLKQASLATGVAVPMLAVTGVSPAPVKHATEQVVSSVQLPVVPRAPPRQE